MAKKKSKKTDADGPTFEQALAKLEGIVHDLEEGDLGLNEALARYEQGVRLLRQSYDLLEGAERRIELLSGIDADGNPITRPFDDSATLSSGDIGGQDSTATPPKGDSGDRSRGKPRSGERDVDAPRGLF